MKTIFITHNYTESSFAAMSYSLAHYLADSGHRVIFISYRPFFNEVKSVKKEKGEIIVCSWSSQKRPTSFKDVLWFSKIYFKYNPDFIIGHFVGANIAAGISKLLSFGKVKTFVYYHTLVEQIAKDQKKRTVKSVLSFYRKIFFYSFFCDTIICPSLLAKNDLEKFYYSKKGLVVLNPIQDRFSDKAVLDSNGIIISYLGRLAPSKGILELVKAFKIYSENNKASNIILNIAGSGSQEMEIRNLAAKQKKFFYLGGLPYDKIDEYLRESHFTIIPSKIDALNMVGIESMMNKTPLLISNTTGLAEYLEDGKECYKFDSNQESIISVLKRVEDNFQSQSQFQMNIEARNTFLNKFSMENYHKTFQNQMSL